MPKIPMQIDLTKPTLSWKYVLVLVAIVVVLLASYAVGTFVFGKVSSLAKPLTKKVEEPTI